MQFGHILFYVTTYFSLFSALLMISTLFENKKKLINPPATKYPAITLIVPAYNEEKSIALTIRSLLDLDYPKGKLDIIVVDDGSTDKTYQISSGFSSSNVKVYKKANGGKASALNFAIKECKTKFVGSLDADSFVERDSLKKMMGYFENPNVMAVTPSLKVYDPKTLLQKIQRIEYLTGIFLRKVFSFLGSIHVTPGPFSLYRKSFFKEFGGYDESTLTEDIEIALRIQSNNFAIENSADAIVYTLGPDNFSNLFKQRIRWYLGFLDNVIKYKHLFNPKYGNLGVFILPASFFSVFLALASFFYASIKYGKALLNYLFKLNSINYDIIKMIDFKLDVFYLNTTNIIFMSVFLLSLGIFILYIARKISNDPAKIRFFYFFYLAFYWMLFSIWWSTVFIYKIIGKRISWEHKSN